MDQIILEPEPELKQNILDAWSQTRSTNFSSGSTALL